MYRLIKSEIIPFHHVASKAESPYRQVKLHYFQKLEAALTACEIYNDKSDSHHYVINESGKAYFEGDWVDYVESSSSIFKS